jgi:hypothetical protein
MAIQVGYLLRGRRVLRRAPHHCRGVKTTPTTQKPDLLLQIGQGLGFAGLGASVIRRRAIFIATPVWAS